MRIYLDYNATAPVRPAVREALAPFARGEVFGNASSIHWAGREAKKHLEAARRRIAAALSRKPSEVIFTGGGSEADNLALRGILERGGRAEGRRLAVSCVEHPAVMETADHLGRAGADVVHLAVDASGRVFASTVAAAFASGADGVPARTMAAASPPLVSVMAANNETGVVMPVDEIADLAHAAGALVHTDAVQAIGRVPACARADLISISGHKLGGLKGAGVLIAREDSALEPLIRGGAQERGRRAGTESVEGAVSLAVALDAALLEQDREAVRLSALRDRLDAAMEKLGGVTILGRAAPRIPGTTTALFEGVERESLLQALDLAGIAASSGSACASGSLEPSHVLLAMGIPRDEALATVRFSMGWGTEAGDIDRVIDVLPTLLARARGLTTR